MDGARRSGPRLSVRGALDVRSVALALSLVFSSAGTAEKIQNVLDDAWASAESYSFSGRLTENHQPADAGSGAVETLYRSTRMLFTSGESGRITLTVWPLHWQTRADDCGYWELRVGHPLPPGTLGPGWHAIASTPTASGPAFLLVHDTRNRYGLVSDIDDTILSSQVLDKAELIRRSLTVPPENRQAVPGMAALYRALSQKNPNPHATPVFYVSATPRQLTDSTRRFLRFNGFPSGVLQLREARTKSDSISSDLRAYKVERIAAILRAFPQVRFALIGDDGEKDPEAYAEIRAQFPKQIDGVWIGASIPILRADAFRTRRTWRSSSSRRSADRYSALCQSAEILAGPSAAPRYRGRESQKRLSFFSRPFAH